MARSLRSHRHGAVIEVVVFGYLERPGWVGVANKKFWDYLEILLVPAAVAVGILLLDRSQRQREQVSEKVQREREQQLEDQSNLMSSWQLEEPEDWRAAWEKLQGYRTVDGFGQYQPGAPLGEQTSLEAFMPTWAAEE
jgi:hypothetical protein